MSEPDKHAVIDLAAIDPARHDKFSPNLHAWLRAKARRQVVREGAVYRMRPDSDAHLNIGFLFDGDLIGARIFTILGKPRERLWSFVGTPIEEVGFLVRYEALGRCALDPEHKILFESRSGRFDDLGRFDEIGETRTCRWCGIVQRRQTYTVERTRWVQVTGHG